MLRAVVVALLGLTACSPSAQPVTECRQLGQQCRIPDGPLGVCSETSRACESPPCLACVSQH